MLDVYGVCGLCAWEFARGRRQFWARPSAYPAILVWVWVLTSCCARLLHAGLRGVWSGYG